MAGRLYPENAPRVKVDIKETRVTREKERTFLIRDYTRIHVALNGMLAAVPLKLCS